MERIVYDRMAEHDATHWWYRARRRVLASLIARKVDLPRDARILEIGCGTGHNLGMLGQFGTVDAIEIDAAARSIASARLGRAVMDHRLPELAGIPDRSYDMIALLDVVEHVEDDRAALVSVARCLKPGGTILITVPQHPWMWSGHDVANHHFRRYTKQSLRASMRAAGLTVELCQSFNSLLFPLAAADRLRAQLTGREGSDDAPPPAVVNTVFEAIFAAERYLIGRVPMPTGVSLVALSRVA